ncbi:copper amine oxidase N-terminal domain-containing protein [Aminipila terrae]|uniref:Copper amine oxidase-like N-terminal domain-containing protein n=1 Tax=Aminipila terrae TaxID=2697030 RepID=A0A6P1MB66_9FIRM|nr:copper amine oxidase N-terminal domain-containing protein [Aminipila terrae]QHI71870.1 hypothetical protein Ami3637_05230 [Aminipila terrae]
MTRNALRALLIVSIVLSMALPVFAAEQPKIQFNGSNVSSDVSPTSINGALLVPARVISDCMGADVQWDNTTKVATITKNTTIIKIKLGEKSADKNGEKIALAAPATLQNGKLMLPLRFFAENFGAQVSWNNTSSAAIITFADSKDGKTVDQYITDCANATTKYSTLKSKGTFTVSADVQGQKSNLQMQIDGAYKLPKESYTKMTMTLPSGTELTTGAIATETYFDGQNIYMKMPGQEWKALEVPNLATMIDSFGSTNQTPQDIYNSMKKFGFIASFGNDVTKDGKQYTVICVKVDKDKFMKMIQQLTSQIADSVGTTSSAITGGTTQSAITTSQVQDEINKALSSMNLDLSYRIYYNKETKIPDYVDLTENISMKADNTLVNTAVTGTMNFYDYGQPVQMPDVTNAKRN